MNGDAHPGSYLTAAIALELIRDNASGLAMAERLGVDPGAAIALRDDLLQRAGASMRQTIEMQQRVIVEQVEELAAFARIAEMYRVPRRTRAPSRLHDRATEPRLFRRALPRARRWAQENLPSSLVRFLRSVIRRVVRS